MPVNWYITGARNNWQVQYDLTNKNYSVEWRLCDGSIVRSDSIPLNSINCGSSESNLILKDAAGNVVYSENISLKSLATFIGPELTTAPVRLFPNPVTDVLNIQYNGASLETMQIEILDISGKQVMVQKLYNVDSGQTIGINVTTLKNGIYIARISSGNQLIGVDKFAK